MEWLIDNNCAGERIDTFLARTMGTSRAEVQRLLGEGHATVNGQRSRSASRLKPLDKVEVHPQLRPAPSAAPEQIPLDIVFQDVDLIVINKPRGMVVHPAPGNKGGTLVNALLAYTGDLSESDDTERPGIVHRLDKDTSGLLVVARTLEALQHLQKQVATHTAARIYLAVVWGALPAREVRVDAPVGRHPVDRKKMAVITDRRTRSRSAATELTLLESLGPCALVQAALETGRTHQIRVHCQYIGCPVVGDATYGGLRTPPASLEAKKRAAIATAIHELGGQALHAGKLAFTHPRTGERLCFEVAPPTVFANLVETLR